MYIDSHTHLSDEKLIGDIDEIITGFSESGIDMVVEIGSDMESSRSAVSLAAKYDCIYAIVGCHPISTGDVTDADMLELESLAKCDKVVAFGEIGLDYHYDMDREEQKKLFISQLLLADKVGLPVVIHLRDAYEDMETILNEYKSYINNGILFHCYSGSAEMVQRFSHLDPYYAFGGAITFKKNNRELAIRAVPTDRLLLETDCPYMTPVPFRGKLNNPNYIPIIAEKMGEALGLTAEQVGELTSANTKRFYRIEN